MDNWRRHIASVGASSSSFRLDFHAVDSAPFITVRSVFAEGSWLFDAPFSASEVRHALTLCSDSAAGLDGLPYSLPNALLAFFNLVFSWSVVPTVWKRSIIVPVFKRGDPTLPNNYRPISLASCFFKVLEHLVHSRIAPHIVLQLDKSQDGFRWSADVLVGSLVSILSARSSSHTFVVFIDIQKAFDISWVEVTLVRLFDAGVRGRMWSLMCNFLHGTQSQVRCGSSLSDPWLDSSIAQGRVLSPLLFNVLINSLIASVRQVAPGVQFSSSSSRVPGQLYADDLELSAECEFDLQVALDAVRCFSFGIGPTKSAVMAFGPRRSIPPCSMHLGGDPLPIVMGYPYLGVILTPTLSWTAHARHLVTRGNRLFANCVAWCKTEGLSLRFASTLFTSCVLPSISWGSEFFISSALRRWGRFLLGWLSGSPVGAFLLAGLTLFISPQAACCHSSDVYTPCPPMAAVLSPHSCSRSHWRCRRGGSTQ